MTDVSRLRQHSLYVRLLVLLLCIALTVILTQAGSLFLVDYIPVSQSAIKKIHQQQLIWKTRIEVIYQGNPAVQENIMENLSGSYLDTSDADFSWLARQDNPQIVNALNKLQKAQQDLEYARLGQAPFDTRLKLAAAVAQSYENMAVALEHDIEIKQSVISLLQLVGLLLVMCCITAIALGARRVMVDRLDRLVSFIPEKLIEVAPISNADEFFQLEQKVFGIMARLEGHVAEMAWANQTSERLRSMVRAQDFLFKFVETVNTNVLSDMTLRKILYALEKALNANNAAVIFADDDSSIASGRITFSHHWPCALNDEIFDELSQAGSVNFLGHNADRIEVRCLAVAFSSASDSMGVLMIETDRDRSLENTEIQLLEVTAQLLSMVMGYQGRDQEGRRIALLEERAAIARELHDSLAQSLSFMKIQIARLQSNAAQGGAESGNAAVISELREGLDNAYRELRELLATFRVHMDVRGLGFAIQSAIDEFSQRSSLSITLDNRLVNCRLTVNEEFHILHVVREALSNIVRHSGASNVSIALVYQSNGTVMVTIDDDGVGYKPTSDGQDHYGQTIMKERAYSLGGDIEVLPRRNGGTRVRLVFTPKLPQ